MHILLIYLLHILRVTSKIMFTSYVAARDPETREYGKKSDF